MFDVEVLMEGNGTRPVGLGLTGDARGAAENMYSSFDLASASPVIMIAGFLIVMALGVTAYFEWRCKFKHLRRIANGVVLFTGTGILLFCLFAIAIGFLKMCLFTGTVAVETDPMIWVGVAVTLVVLYVIGYAGEKAGWNFGEEELTPVKRGRGRPRKVQV